MLKGQCHKDITVWGKFCAMSLLGVFTHKKNVPKELWRRNQPILSRKANQNNYSFGDFCWHTISWLNFSKFLSVSTFAICCNGQMENNEQ